MLELSSLREHLRGKLVCSITLTVLDFCMIALQGFHIDLPPLDEFKGKNKIVSLQLLAVTLSTI